MYLSSLYKRVIFATPVLVLRKIIKNYMQRISVRVGTFPQYRPTERIKLQTLVSETSIAIIVSEYAQFYDASVDLFELNALGI